MAKEQQKGGDIDVLWKGVSAHGAAIFHTEAATEAEAMAHGVKLLNDPEWGPIRKLWLKGGSKVVQVKEKDNAKDPYCYRNSQRKAGQVPQSK